MRPMIVRAYPTTPLFSPGQHCETVPLYRIKPRLLFHLIKNVFSKNITYALINILALLLYCEKDSLFKDTFETQG
jgi:hypothetical protein